jgi:hypothetical protein
VPKRAGASRRFRIFARKLFEDEGGQGTVEYILLLSASSVMAIGIGRALIGAFDGGILYIGGWLEKDLKSGRESLELWRN